MYLTFQCLSQTFGIEIFKTVFVYNEEMNGFSEIIIGKPKYSWILCNILQIPVNGFG